VWSITTQSSKQTHFAAFPEKLVEPCILAGCPLNGVILDPFCGSGTTGVTALKHGRNFIGIDLKPEYVQMAKKRLDSLKDQPFPSESPEEILNRTQGEILA
jgi:DNA modification methylase